MTLRNGGRYIFKAVVDMREMYTRHDGEAILIDDDMKDGTGVYKVRSVDNSNSYWYASVKEELFYDDGTPAADPKPVKVHLKGTLRYEETSWFEGVEVEVVEEALVFNSTTVYRVRMASGAFATVLESNIRF